VNTSDQPLVSVLTPVYNGEKYLVECIESVLSQTYQNFEYLIVNNCSKDRTLEIAQSYARKDCRIRVHDNDQFFEIMANHNHAFGLISPAAKYCKVVSGDDLIMPECLTQMVALAEANPNVGIVGCYQQSKRRVLWQGYAYPKSVFSGREVCRQVFLGDNPNFGFGTPTSVLYRADLVRKTSEFYPNPSPHSDTSACFASLQHCDFGFVYQVLSFERIHDDQESSASVQLNRYAPSNLNDIVHYAAAYLNEDELKRTLENCLKGYRRFLAIAYFGKSPGDAFWDYHRARLKELGYPLKRSQLYRALAGLLYREVRNPQAGISKLRKLKSKVQR
jgi:glycosyltransferase involved in cell wall biosynthesis